LSLQILLPVQKELEMTQADLMKLAIAGGILFAGYKFGPGFVKAGCLAVGAVAVAKRIPYVSAVL
jgi:hypothetical protein